MSLTVNLLRSYRDPRGVMRNQLSQGGGDRVAIVYLLLACFLLFLAQYPRLRFLTLQNEDLTREGLLAGMLFGMLFIAPLLFYGLATVLGGLMLLIHRGTSLQDVRLAFFWTLLAISPVELARGALLAFAGPGPLVGLVGVVVLVGFLAILVAGSRAALDVARARA